MWVHEQCLLDWMERSGTDFCEMCGHKYVVKRVYASGEAPRVPLGMLLCALCERLGSAAAGAAMVLALFTEPLLTYWGLCACVGAPGVDAVLGRPVRASAVFAASMRGFLAALPAMLLVALAPRRLERVVPFLGALRDLAAPENARAARGAGTVARACRILVHSVALDWLALAVLVAVPYAAGGAVLAGLRAFLGDVPAPLSRALALCDRLVTSPVARHAFRNLAVGYTVILVLLGLAAFTVRVEDDDERDEDVQLEREHFRFVAFVREEAEHHHHHHQQEIPEQEEEQEEEQEQEQNEESEEEEDEEEILEMLMNNVEEERSVNLRQVLRAGNMAAVTGVWLLVLVAGAGVVASHVAPAATGVGGPALLATLLLGARHVAACAAVALLLSELRGVARTNLLRHVLAWRHWAWAPLLARLTGLAAGVLLAAAGSGPATRALARALGASSALPLRFAARDALSALAGAFLYADRAYTLAAELADAAIAFNIPQRFRVRDTRRDRQRKWVQLARTAATLALLVPLVAIVARTVAALGTLGARALMHAMLQRVAGVNIDSIDTKGRVPTVLTRDDSVPEAALFFAVTALVRGASVLRRALRAHRVLRAADVRRALGTLRAATASLVALPLLAGHALATGTSLAAAWTAWTPVTEGMSPALVPVGARDIAVLGAAYVFGLGARDVARGRVRAFLARGEAHARWWALATVAAAAACYGALPRVRPHIAPAAAQHAFCATRAAIACIAAAARVVAAVRRRYAALQTELRDRTATLRLQDCDD